MSEIFNENYTGLRYLESPFGDLIDLETEPQKFEDLADFNISQPIDKQTQKRQSEKPQPVKTKEIPKEFLNKSWDELYRLDKLPTIQKQFPELYKRLRKERFNY